MKRIIITGALGQIGSELTLLLRKEYGTEHVLATDIQKNNNGLVQSGPFQNINVMDLNELGTAAQNFKADTIIHLAAILSAKAELNPVYAWRLNMEGLLNALETARQLQIQFFTPSSIGSFGPLTPKNQTPQDTIQRPITMYGINKVAGELLADYYYHKYGVDTRGLRLPGLISYVTKPGGGTTDYAVEIFYDALKKGSYTSYLKKGTYLDMMYMPDALKAIITLLEANPSRLKHRNAFNVTSMSFSPEELAAEIKKHIPNFSLSFKIDPVRQAIADSWPNSIDTSLAVLEWGYTYHYNLQEMTKDMIDNIRKK